MFELIRNNQRLGKIDSLLDTFLNDSFSNHENFYNKIDYYFSDDDVNYYIDLALPGLEKKDINLNVTDNYLFLNYESKDNNDHSFWNRSFSRRIKLPSNIKKDAISAKLKNGILSIKIKKDIEEIKSKKIEIK